MPLDSLTGLPTRLPRVSARARSPRDVNPGTLYNPTVAPTPELGPVQAPPMMPSQTAAPMQSQQTAAPPLQQSQVEVALPVGGGMTNLGAPIQGYDRGKWYDPTHNTPKYAIGRVLSDYDPRTANLEDLRRALMATGLIDQFTGDDTFRLKDGVEGGGHEIDFWQAYNNPDPNARQWWWGDQTAAGQPAAPTAPGTPRTPTPTVPRPRRANDPDVADAPMIDDPAGGGNRIPGPMIDDPVWDPNNPDGGGGGGGGTGDDEFDAWLRRFVGSGGITPYGKWVQDRLKDIATSGGLDDAATQQRLIGAREANANAMQSQTADLRSTLAARGLVGQPGVSQGIEGSAIGNITEDLGQTYADSVRDIETGALDRANDNVMQALELATGMSSDQTRALLDSVSQGTDRKRLMADIALETLSQNRQWNEFLAKHGLDREKLLWEMENGDMNSLLLLLQQFMSGLGISSGGYI